MPRLLVVSMVVALWRPALLSAQGGPAAPPRDTTPIALTGVTVIDVSRGRPVAAQTVVVRGARIAAVGPSRTLRPPPGARVVDARGKFLIPGLWDMHAHAAGPLAAVQFPLFVANGVTGVRDMGGPSVDSLRDAKARTASGAVAGPRIIGAGPVIDGAPVAYPRLSVVARTADESRRAVDSLAALGVDFIKAYEMLTRESFLALAAQAKARGLDVAGHVPLAVDAAEASDAGLRSFEHLRNLDLACSSAADSIRGAHAAALAEAAGGARPGRAVRAELHDRRLTRVLDSYDAARCAALAARLARNGTWQVPTLAVWASRLGLDTVAHVRDRLRYMPPGYRELWLDLARRAAEARTPAWLAQNRRVVAQTRQLVRLLRDSGVGLLAGSDTPNPWVVAGFSLHDELTLLVEAGLTTQEALRAATLAPARFLGAADSLGTVERGKVADLVLLDGDPLADIRNTRRIRAVLANGRLFDRAALDTLLSDAERAAARLTAAPPR